MAPDAIHDTVLALGCTALGLLGGWLIGRVLYYTKAQDYKIRYEHAIATLKLFMADQKHNALLKDYEERGR